MEIIKLLLAKFFDKLKISNPVIFGVVAVVIAISIPGINTAIETGLMKDSPTLAKIVETLIYLSSIVMGVRTTQTIENSKKEE